MTTDSFFSLMVTAMMAELIGLTMAFLGYRFFLVFLPILGFLFGFGFGTEALQAIVGDGPFATVTSWMVGFLFAVCFAVLSYLFYLAGVAILAGALGYALGVGLMQAIGFDFGLITWLVGVVAGVAVAGATLWFNIQKYVVILATSVWGAAVMVGTCLFLFGGTPPADTVANPVRAALQQSPLWMIVYVATVALSVAVQVATTRHMALETYNRLTGQSLTPDEAEDEPIAEPATQLPQAS